MNLLTELANKYQTDKGTTTEPAHGYTEIYHQYLLPLRGSANKILEIGIAGGASLRMWREYFPHATVFGIDHNEAYVNAVNPPMIQTCFGEATDPRYWKRFEDCWGKDFDLIIDDGGHYTDQIVKGFDGAWPLLRSGGLYFIEDLHQIYHQEHSPYTALDWLDKHITRDRVDERGKYQSAKRVEPACDVEFIHRYKSLAIMKKR